jgi:hypothetical protein
MAKTFLISTVAALTLGGSMLASSVPAQAQVNVEFGVGPGMRFHDERPYRPVVERRLNRRVIVDNGEECRVEIRRRVNRFGEVVTRRLRICE